jgi:hypothetical protein
MLRLDSTGLGSTSVVPTTSCSYNSYRPRRCASSKLRHIKIHAVIRGEQRSMHRHYTCMATAEVKGCSKPSSWVFYRYFMLSLGFSIRGTSRCNSNTRCAYLRASTTGFKHGVCGGSIWDQPHRVFWDCLWNQAGECEVLFQVISGVSWLYLFMSTEWMHFPWFQIAKTFKNQQVLTNCSWEVKKGERVGLVGKLPQAVTQCCLGSHVCFM